MKHLIYTLPRTDYYKDDLVKLGDKVYYPVPDKLVVPATVTEVDFVVVHPEFPKDTIWAYAYPDKEFALVPKRPPETNDGGWSITEEVKIQTLLDEGCQICNEFIWIDEPTGHELQIDYELFWDLEEALTQVKGWDEKKHYPGQQKAWFLRWRQKIKEFVASTQKKSVEEIEWGDYPDKKVYYYYDTDTEEDPIREED